MIARLLQIVGTELILAGTAAWIVETAKVLGIAMEVILLAGCAFLVPACINYAISKKLR